MTSKRRKALAAIILPSAIILGFSVFGAIHVPTGMSIAVALVMAISLLVETPLAAMAVAKYKRK